MVANWLKNGLKHWSNHKGLLAQINKENAIVHGWVRDINCPFIAMELKIVGICLKIDVIVLCKESPYNFISVLGLFSVISNHEVFIR